ncbi:MAG TPA: ribosomal protein S18-alanine N-acetyltransferase [Ilumatobacter sp.]|nr:ribosomal protein S18-alanine N-acetyltransferase [Ilumatobacter sp.]
MSVIPRLLGRSDEDEFSFVLEPLRRRHLRAVLPIEAAAYPTSWSRSVFESELAQVREGTRHYVVARIGKAVVGYAGLWFVPDPDGDQAHITNIVVAEPFRRQGVARRLMLALAAEAIRRGCVAWTLEVRASSDGARELYRRFGFAPAGVRKRYYDNVEDAIVMWCHDLATPEYAARLERLS